jgi:hypothetical protein
MSMRRRSRPARPALALAFALMVLGFGAARAAPLAYDEASNGDLPESSGWPVLTLDTGVNTVKGSQYFRAIYPNVTSDFDSFQFVVPLGGQLTGIGFGITVTNSTGPAVSELYLDTFIDSGGPSYKTVVAHEQMNLLDPASPIAGSFAAGLPLDAGTYLLFEGQMGVLDFWGQGVDWDYTWTFTVAPAPVPEPDSAASFGGMVTMLGAVALWRRAKARPVRF